MAAIVPQVLNLLFNKLKVGKWEVGKKVETNLFYAKVLIFILILGTVNGVIFFTLLEFRKLKILYIFVIAFLVFIQVKFINTRKSIKLRTFGTTNKYSILIIDAPLVIYTFLVCLSLTDDVDIVKFGCTILILICEFIGLLMFQSSYTIYFYSFARIKLNTLEELRDINVEKLYKSGKWLIIKENNLKKLILFDNVICIEYYGEPKYILNKSIGELFGRKK